MNVLYSGFSNEHSNVLLYLEEKLKSDNVHVIDNTSNDVKVRCKTLFLTKDCQIGCFPKNINYEQLPLSQGVLNSLSECESVALKMMERYQNLQGLLTYDARINMYHRQVKFWYNFLIKEKIDLCIFVNLPHVVYDYVIYSLCKLLKIKFVTLYRLPVMPYQNVSIYTLSDLNTHISGLRQAYEFNLLNADEIALSERMTSYLQLKVSNENKTFTGITKNPYSFLNSYLDRVKKIVNVLRNDSIENFAYIMGDKFRRCGISKPIYLTEPDLDCEYIYVSLHFQPECTTSPMGGAFVHQDLMIDILKQSCSKGLKLYIKEHPRGSINSRVYEWVSTESNIFFVAPLFSSYDLIKNSVAVATVTGTAGWEGFINNKPILMFGDYFYQDAPGVFKIKSQEDCISAINSIRSGKVKISDSEIIAFLKAVDQCSFPGWVDHRYASLTDLSSEENCENIAKHLLREINVV